jgi:hypothetical protein
MCDPALNALYIESFVLIWFFSMPTIEKTRPPAMGNAPDSQIALLRTGDFSNEKDARRGVS